MYSQPNDFQMPRTIPIHHEHLFQQQLQVFQQQYQAFQQHHQNHHHQQQQRHHHHHQHHSHSLLNQYPQDFASSANRVDTPPSSSVSSLSPMATDEHIEMGSNDNDKQMLEEETDDDGEDEEETQDKRRRRDPDSSSARGSSSREKSKRVRTIFTQEQLKRLEQEFSNQMYLVGHDRVFLANSLNLTEAQVKVWFQNRRIKFRKLNSSSSLQPKIESISKGINKETTTRTIP